MSTISHPDFAFVANSGPKQNPGNNGLTLLPFSHISGINIAKQKSKVSA